MTIQLPKNYQNELGNFPHLFGKPKISWSQIESFLDKKGFNTGQEGRVEYILKYFFNKEFKNWGWGDFGHDVESYICERGSAETFTQEEKKVLDEIVPLGVFQYEFCLDFGDFVLQGFIDDMSPDYKILRDYKTKSENSKKDLHLDKKHQMEIYSLAILQDFGTLPEKIEYCIIERNGNPFKGGERSALSVGKRVWYEPYVISPERLEITKSLIINTVEEISACYQLYLKINQII